MHKRRLFFLGLISVLVILLVFGLPRLLIANINETSVINKVERFFGERGDISVKVNGSLTTQIGLSPVLILDAIEVSDKVSGKAIASIQTMSLKTSWLALLQEDFPIANVELTGVYSRYDNDFHRSFSTALHNITRSIKDGRLSSVPVISMEEVVVDFSEHRLPGSYSAFDLIAIKSVEIEDINPADLSAQISVEGILSEQNRSSYYSVDATSRIMHDLAAKSLVFTNWRSHSFFKNNLDQHPNTVAINGDRFHWQYEKQKLQAQNLSFSLDEIAGVADIQVQLGERYYWQSAVQLEAFDAGAVNSALVTMPWFQTTWLIPNLAIGTTDLSITGNREQIAIKNLHSSIAGSALTGQLVYQIKKSAISSFDLSLDQFSLDQLFDSDLGSSQKLHQAVLLPDWLWTLPVSGQWHIGKLTAQTHEFENIGCRFDKLNSQSLSLINCQWQHPAFNLTGDVNFQKSSDSPMVDATIEIQNLPISKWLSQPKAIAASTFEGSVAGKVNLNARGQTAAAWLKSLSGDGKLDVDQFIINGINLDNLVIDGLSRETIDNLPLVMGMTPEQLPRTSEHKMAVPDIKLAILFTDGRATVKDLFLSTKNADKLVSNVWVDLTTMQINSNSLVRLGLFKNNPYLSDFAWPLTCEGVISENTFNDICSASIGNLQALISKVVAQRNKEVVEREAQAAIAALSSTNPVSVGSASSATVSQGSPDSYSTAEETLKEELQQSLLDSVFGQ